MKHPLEKVVMDIPVFYDEVPKEKFIEEIKKRNGETVLLADRNNFSGSFTLCKIKIDPSNRDYYLAQIPIGDSEKGKALEIKLKYENILGLKVKTKYGPSTISRVYRVMSE